MACGKSGLSEKVSLSEKLVWVKQWAGWESRWGLGAKVNWRHEGHLFNKKPQQPFTHLQDQSMVQVNLTMWDGATFILDDI